VRMGLSMIGRSELGLGGGWSRRGVLLRGIVRNARKGMEDPRAFVDFQEIIASCYMLCRGKVCIS